MADSLKQCFGFGELTHGKRSGVLTEADPRIVELGALLSTQAHKQRGGAEDRRLTIADSTGVGASDLCIAEAAYAALAPGALPKGPPMAHRWKVARPRSRM